MPLENVFAYGSNMDLGDVRRWFRVRGRPEGRMGAPTVGVLRGHRLVWNYHSNARGGGAANVEPHGDYDVHGVLVAVDAAALEGIDAKEGRGERYERSLVTIETTEGPARAWLYEVLPAFRQAGLVPPTRAYLAILIGAAEHFGFPGDYIEMLRAVPTVD